MPYLDIAILVALPLWTAHWLPWRKLLGSDLPRLATYAIGALTIIAIPTYMHLRSPMDAHQLLIAFWVSLIAAGAATISAWSIDAILEGWHKGRDEDARYGQ